MRKLKLIGIGAGNPDYITVQAVNALKEVDVIFVTHKGQETADLLRARKDVCERYMQSKPYRTIEITSCEIVSKVVTVFELASNARCAIIRLENSVEMLTFDCSSAPSTSVPRPPAPATPTVASPEAAVVIKLLPPETVNPAVLATVATASCPIVEVRPLLKFAVITPAESTRKL